MSNIFMSTENSKTNDPNRFRLYFTSKIDLRGNKKIALSDLSIHCTWHNIKEEYNINKFRLSGPTWSKDVTIPDGSYEISQIQTYFLDEVIKKHEADIKSNEQSPILIFANRILSRVTFRIKRGYKLELLTNETMKLSNFMFTLDFLLINSEMELILKWSQNCVVTEKAERGAKPLIPAEGGNAEIPTVPAVNVPSDLKFNITDCKLYVPLVTLQAEYQNQLYKELKTGIPIDFKLTKYRSQMVNQTATNSLNFLIDPNFNNVNRLFVLAFPNEEDRRSFSKYYTPTVEIKVYNVIIDGQPFYEIPIKNKEETYKAITELIRSDILRTGNEFNFDYFCEHYKLIAIDLSKQISDSKNHQINFIGKLEQDATIFFYY